MEDEFIKLMPQPKLANQMQYFLLTTSFFGSLSRDIVFIYNIRVFGPNRISEGVSKLTQKPTITKKRHSLLKER